MHQLPDDFSTLLPLREPTFLILLSLAEGEKHGYAILKDVTELSQERVILSTGTLYEALVRLLDQALIERIDTQEVQHPGKARKAYRLTLKGQRVIEAETVRLQNLLAVARRRLGSEGG